jgi:hypothetical protein
MDIEIEEKANLSAFNLNFLKFSMVENTNINTNNFNNNSTFFPNQKKNSLDISYSIEHTFYENSNINIEEEFQPIEENCKN